MKKVLIINPTRNYFPPTNGGKLRLYYILRELCKHFEVHQVTYIHQDTSNQELIKQYQYPNNMIVHTPAEYKQTKNVFDLLPVKLANALRTRWITKSISTPANDFILQVVNALNTVLKQHEFDIIIFEHLLSLSFAQMVNKYAPHAFKILNAYNVDSTIEMQKMELEKSHNDKEYKRLLKIESSLNSYVHQVWVCSEDDKNEFCELNGGDLDVLLVPNGVDVELNDFQEETREDAKRLIFCGGLDYYPNYDGLNWFLEEVYPGIRDVHDDVTLTLVGKSMDKLNSSLLDESIKVEGFVDSVIPYYRKSDISIVPLRIGSGTRLKILESMSLGIPIMSTSIGAKGIEHKNGHNILLEDDSDAMSNRINAVLSDPFLLAGLKKNARELVEQKYDWIKIGKNIAAKLA